jgi:hypothetical protein
LTQSGSPAKRRTSFFDRNWLVFGQMNRILRKFIAKIEGLQSKGDSYFSPGLFPAYRENPLIAYRRADTTMFFSAIISFTLNSIRDGADDETKSVIDSISGAVARNYPDFQNKDGLQTYNFWKTKPSRHFPNGFIFRHLDHFRIPDDIDDTAFAYLTTHRSKEEMLWLKDKLAQHANGAKQHIRNTYPEYFPLKAYSTWFGKHMYIEFDAGVLSNILYCIFQYDLPLNENDEDSMRYICSVIETNRYLEVPFRCAHQYPRSELIIYHVARLIAAFDPEPLRAIKHKLIADTKMLLAKTTIPMHRVILSTSLIRLGEITERIEVEEFTSADFSGFYFFIAGLLTAYESRFLYALAANPLFHMYWTCEAHNWTLLAEYEVLWSAANKSEDQS